MIYGLYVSFYVLPISVYALYQRSDMNADMLYVGLQNQQKIMSLLASSRCDARSDQMFRLTCFEFSIIRFTIPF